MSTITNFTWDEFWNVQEQYNDMLCDIEDRIIEIAKELGEVYDHNNIRDIFFEHDQLAEYVVAEMDIGQVGQDGEPVYDYFKVNVKWLFSDNFKQEIDEKLCARKRQDAIDYKEYLRLKAKFEN